MGNDVHNMQVRMGKGKGSFDHWASRIEFYLGQYEFVKKGDPPVVGITKLDGITMEELKRPRRKIPLGSVPAGPTAEALPSTASASASPAA